MQTNLLGIHFADNIYSEAQVAKHMELLRAIRPACINVLGGAQYDQALGFALTVRRDLPETKVIFRHYKDGGDDGMHTRLSASEWWQKIGSLYKGKDLTILTDNESMAADLHDYAAWQAAVMTLAGAHGVSVAYGRFSTHQPPKSQIPQLDAMFRTAEKFLGFHVYSPNVYFDETNNDGHEYPFHVIQRCADIGIAAPTIMIGEYAYAFNLRAGEGYRWNGINGGDYINNLLIPRFNKYFAGARIPVSIYCEGKWPKGINEQTGKDNDTFGLDDDAKKALIENAKRGLPPVVIVPPAPPQPPPVPPKNAPVPKPANAGELSRVKVIPPAGVLNRRDGPNESYTKTGEFKTGDLIHLYRDTKRVDPDNPAQHWYWVESEALVGDGWIADVNGKVVFEDFPTVPEPEPEPPPPTDKQLSIDAMKLAIAQFTESIAQMSSAKALLELALNKLENGI